MSSLPYIDQSASKAKYTSRHDSNSNTPPPGSVHHCQHDTTLESWFASDQNDAFTWPATISTSHQPSEASETTMLGGFYDGGTFDNASSVTLQDEFPWHEVEVNKYRIPSTIFPALLQGVSDVSPSSRSSLDGAEGKSREVDEDSGSGDVLPRYSAVQKGKWKARTDDDILHGNRWARIETPRFHFQGILDPVEEWVIHNRPILQDYADRQTSLPLGRRLEVSIDEPPQFILGALQLLANRDQRGCTDRSRQLGPQLIENFVDIDRWAKEYFRSRHGTQVVDSDVSTLLTIVMNNFYDGQVQLIDRLVEFALENMHFCGRSSLRVEDFAFGFDFKMSQDLPFYVETSSQLREPLPIRAVEVRSTPEPVITSSGRQVKPTKRAQEASEQAQTNVSGRRNKGKNTSQVKDKQAGSVLPAHQKNKSPAQLSSDRTVPETPRAAAPAPSETTSAHTKHRPIQPSNLGLPPISPGSSSTSGTTPPRLDDSSKSKTSGSASADGPAVSGSLGSNLKNQSSPRLKVILPAMSSRVPASSNSGLTSSNSNSTPANALKAPILGRVTRRSGRTQPGGPRNGYIGGRGCGREYGNESPTLSAEAPEATSVNVNAPSTAHPVGAGDAVATAAISMPVAHPTDVLGNSAGTTSSAGSHGADNSIVQPLLPPSDPDHPQGKKRKLDDCED